MYQFHFTLFDWHCRTFFPFHRHLSPQELAYLKCCFHLGRGLRERPPSGYPFYSYYSYSHRVTGAEVNSTRFAYGSLTQPDVAFAAAREVLYQRRIDISRVIQGDFPYSFYGLGWDFAERHFKIYFLVPQLEALRHRYPELFGARSDDAREEGLLSFTFEGTQIVERKIYFYPKSLREVPSGVASQAFMVTSERGLVPQHDVSDAEQWRLRLNTTGQEILKSYTAVGLPLDTIAYQDRDHYTLYFP